nr:helix-turn-helix domain-containing protein [Halobacterium salinarum]
MKHLDDISVEELQDALDNADGKKPTQRLLAAIAYKNGVTQTELAEWYDVQRRTIYSWLTRLDTDESLEHAASDDKRTGRNRKLSETQQNEFEATVHDPPEEVGLDAPAWTPALAQEYLEEYVFSPRTISVGSRRSRPTSAVDRCSRRTSASLRDGLRDGDHPVSPAHDVVRAVQRRASYAVC